MSSSPPADLSFPLPLTDQHGRTAFAWFPPGSATDPGHVLPWPVFAAVCRLAGVAVSSPWVAFRTRPDALAVLVAARLTAGTDTAPIRLVTRA